MQFLLRDSLESKFTDAAEMSFHTLQAKNYIDCALFLINLNICLWFEVATDSKTHVSCVMSALAINKFSEHTTLVPTRKTDQQHN